MRIVETQPVSPISSIQVNTDWSGEAHIFLKDQDEKGALKFITVRADRLVSGEIADKLHLAPAFILMRAIALASAYRQRQIIRDALEAPLAD